jgi:hypothetical protein
MSAFLQSILQGQHKEMIEMWQWALVDLSITHHMRALGVNRDSAAAVTVNLGHWDWQVPAGMPVAVSPVGGPEGIWTGNQPQFPDIGGYGNHEYGNYAWPKSRAAELPRGERRTA